MLTVKTRRGRVMFIAVPGGHSFDTPGALLPCMSTASTQDVAMSQDPAEASQ